MLVDQQKNFSEEQIDLVKEMLVDAFRQSQKLNEVTRVVIGKLKEYQEGSWICSIRPPRVS